ncbi:MAG TPA: zinc ABC transporter substrate-binding protein [Microbacteriaceae bacterium]|nr:zinc ABC transporter substrate-binding protein [Microbacteriaceae bacterium]
MRIGKMMAAGLAAIAVVAGLAGCAPAEGLVGRMGAGAGGGADRILVVGAENQYSDVAAQIGGKYVTATAIIQNPNTDPHTFEASVSVAKDLSAARIVVQNGLGYDDFMTKLESASPSKDRIVITAQDVLGLPNDTANPHLWYDPKTMPAVAKRIAASLGRIDPSHKAYFAKNLATFDASMKTWGDQLAAFRSTHAGTPVAVTEPVADDLLKAAGVDVETPWSLQAAIMNDTDPSPQDSALQNALLTGKKVKALLYNRQVTDQVTERFLRVARANGIPVVGVSETMPAGYHYQGWMEATLKALRVAIETGASTDKR